MSASLKSYPKLKFNLASTPIFCHKRGMSEEKTQWKYSAENGGNITIKDVSEYFDQIALALAKAQSDFKPLNKSKTAKVRGRTKAGKEYDYEYKYADLSDVIDSVKTALSKNEISFCQIINLNLLETWLIHSSGQRIVSQVELPKAETPQALGSLLTYYKRYQLSALVGIAAEEDDDGQAGNQSKPVQNKPPVKQAKAVGKAPQGVAKRTNDQDPEDHVFLVGSKKGKKVKDLSTDELEELGFKIQAHMSEKGDDVDSRVVMDANAIEKALEVRKVFK